MGNDGKCEHKPCNCAVTDDGSYCSEQCKDAAGQDIVQIACGCGHASCG